MSAGDSSHSARIAHRLIAALSYVVLFGGIATAAMAVYMVVLCYTPLPWSDGWTQIASAAAGTRPWSPAWLWQQHNEHRLLVPKLFLACDLQLFRAQQKLLLASISAIQFLHLGLLSWSLRALGGWRGPLWRTATGLGALALFCPTQWENLTWGFQTCFVLPPLFATAGFVALLLAWRSASPDSWKLVLISVLAAFAAACSLASGLLVLPLLALAAVVLRLRPAIVFTYAAAAVACVAIYFHGYMRPLQNADPISSLRAPLKLASYMATYFGSSWVAGHSWDDHNLAIAPYVGLCGLVLLLWTVLGLRAMLQRREALFVLLTLLSVFCLATALLTALGRVASGNGQAFSSRYQTVALLFWWAVGCMLLGVAQASSRPMAVAAVQALFVLVLVRGLVFVHFPLRDAREHAFEQRAAAAALLTGVDDRAQISSAFPDPDFVLRLVPFMRERQLSIFAHESPRGRRLDAVAQIAGREPCQGALQSMTAAGDGEQAGLRITGWAWEPGAHQPATEILAISNGSVIGLGASGDWRPEIRARRPNMNTSFIGFTAYARPLPDEPVAIYAVFPGSAPRACEIATIAARASGPSAVKQP